MSSSELSSVILRADPPCTGTTKISLASWSNEMYRPSGDHLGVAAAVTCPGSVSRAVFEPSLSQIHISEVPVRVEVNAIRFLSGEYCGFVSNCVEEISLVGWLGTPAGLVGASAGLPVRQMSRSQDECTNANRLPRRG